MPFASTKLANFEEMYALSDLLASVKRSTQRAHHLAVSVTGWAVQALLRGETGKESMGLQSYLQERATLSESRGTTKGEKLLQQRQRSLLPLPSR